MKRLTRVTKELSCRCINAVVPERIGRGLRRWTDGDLDILVFLSLLWLTSLRYTEQPNLKHWLSLHLFGHLCLTQMIFLKFIYDLGLEHHLSKCQVFVLKNVCDVLFTSTTVKCAYVICCLLLCQWSFFCPAYHPEEEGIIFLAVLESHDRLQWSPFTTLIASTPSQISSVMAAPVHHTTHGPVHISPLVYSLSNDNFKEWLHPKALKEPMFFFFLESSTLFGLFSCWNREPAPDGCVSTRLCETGFQDIAPCSSPVGLCSYNCNLRLSLKLEKWQPVTAICSV